MQMRMVTKYFTCILDVSSTGKVIGSTSNLKWMVGKDVKEVIDYYNEARLLLSYNKVSR